MILVIYIQGVENYVTNFEVGGGIVWPKICRMAQNIPKSLIEHAWRYETF